MIRETGAPKGGGGKVIQEEIENLNSSVTTEKLEQYFSSLPPTTKKTHRRKNPPYLNGFTDTLYQNLINKQYQLYTNFSKNRNIGNIFPIHFMMPI